MQEVFNELQEEEHQNNQSSTAKTDHSNDKCKKRGTQCPIGELGERGMIFKGD